MKKFLTAAMLFATALGAWPLRSDAQNETMNLQKYWYYRDRLVNDFMLVGDCQGCSMPAQRRHLVPSSPGWDPVLEWGDGLLHMGYYIGMLSTEYYLLQHHGQSTAKTREELYYALRAINRLDAKAEPHLFGAEGCPETVNGFYLRDCVPAGFVAANQAHFNQGLQEPAGISLTSSDYIKDNPFDDEESHDQLISLMMGLRMLTEFVDENANHNNMSVDGATTSLEQAAKNICERIMNRYMQDAWLLFRPCDGHEMELVHTGANSWAFAVGIADMASKIMEDPQLAVLYNAAAAPTIPAWDIGVLASSMSWLNQVMYLKLVSCGTNSPSSRSYVVTRSVDNIGTPEKDVEWFALLHAVLNNYDLTNNLWPETFENYLNDAPCLGPYNYYETDGYATFHWSTNNLLDSPERKGTYMPTIFQGDYNGIDYMLMYNLYCIKHIQDGGPVVSYSDLSEIHIAQDYPYTMPILNLTFGDHDTPGHLQAFTRITADNEIGADGDITYQAGEEIILMPGFTVLATADFHAYIDPLDQCNSNGWQRNAAQASGDEGSGTIPGPPSVFPNPSAGDLTINWPGNSDYSIDIYNMLGGQVLATLRADREQITLSGIAVRVPPGIYLVRLANSHGRQHWEKVILGGQ